MNQDESKARETLRYLGYSLGAVAAMIVAGLLYLLLAPIMEILQLLAWIAGAAFFAFFCIAAIFYLFIDKNRK